MFSDYLRHVASFLKVWGGGGQAYQKRDKLKKTTLFVYLQNPNPNPKTSILRLIM